AQGTDFNGLDLSDEPKKAEEKKAEEEDRPRAPPLEEAAARPAETPGRITEVEIANEDRVKSVQRKAFLKKARLELTPMGFVTLNDAFYPKMGPGGRLAFFFSDSLGLALRYQQYNIVSSDNVRLAKRQLQSKLPKVYPQHSFAAELLFSPVYGKIAVGNAINTFDLYLVGGAGAFWTQTSSDKTGSDGQVTAGDGLKPSVHIGIGERFSLTDWFALDLSLVETLYVDRPDGLPKSVVQNLVTIHLGLSVFLPFGFEYKEP
ncbi:MAG: outer membrane beta-barrel domain-containing protein, partial [Deltaproteobacteria bacterium]|nr:outer membrane beta-barrel domain-containing protein [Deltaproteobacteria bacterium]